MSQEATINEFAGTGGTPRSEAERSARGVHPPTPDPAGVRGERAKTSTQADPLDATRLFTLAGAYQFMAGTWTGLH